MLYPSLLSVTKIDRWRFGWVGGGGGGGGGDDRLSEMEFIWHGHNYLL